MKLFARALVRASLLCALVAPELAAATLEIRQVGTPIRVDQAMVWDSRRGEALMLGGKRDVFVLASDVWRLVRTGAPHWERLEVTGSPPAQPAGMAAVYDSLRDRVLCFGGGDLSSMGSSGLWALELSGTPTWRQLVTTGPQPRQRFHARMIIDVRDRLVVFGGDGYNNIDPLVWALPLAADTLRWQPVITPDEGPGARERHGMVYSRFTDRVTVFGGDRFVRYGPFEAEYERCDRTTWELVFTPSPHWVARSSAPSDSVPEASNACALVADPDGEYAWFLPGLQAANVNDPSVWKLDLRTSQWSRLSPSGASPVPRVLAGACFDPGRRQLIVQGGGTKRPFQVVGTVWSDFDPLLDNMPSGWTLSTAGAGFWQRILDAPRFRSVEDIADVHYDPRSHRLYRWTPEGIESCDVSKGDWARDSGTAFPFVSPGTTATALDLTRRWMVVLTQLADGTARVWYHPLDSLDRWHSAAVSDDLNDPTFVPLRARMFHDAKRDRFVLLPWEFRGVDTLKTLEQPYVSPGWVRYPLPYRDEVFRQGPSYALDEARDHLIVVGGAAGSEAPNRSVLSLSLTPLPVWTVLSSQVSTPFPGGLAGAYWDPTLDRLVVVGGQGMSFFDVGRFPQVHALPLGAGSRWQDLDPEGLNELRGATRAFYDPIRQETVFWNGELWRGTWSVGTPAAFGAGETRTDSGHVRITWQGDETTPYAARVERSDDGGRTWGFVTSAMPDASGQLVATDTTVSGAAAAYRAVITRGGTDRVLGTATLGTASTPLSQPVARFALAPIRPNPARDIVTVELALPAGGEVTLQVFDLNGRRVGETWRRALSAGRVSIPLSLAHGLRPGLYLVRASDGTHDSSARLVVTR